MRICKRCYTSFIPTETQQKRHNTSYCPQCSEDMMNTNKDKSSDRSIKKRNK